MPFRFTVLNRRSTASACSGSPTRCTGTASTRRFIADEGRGVFWEGRIIHNYIYDAKSNKRYIAVLFEGARMEYIRSAM